jgi:hypothetical protein
VVEKGGRPPVFTDGNGVLLANGAYLLLKDDCAFFGALEWRLCRLHQARGEKAEKSTKKAL